MQGNGKERVRWVIEVIKDLVGKGQGKGPKWRGEDSEQRQGSESQAGLKQRRTEGETGQRKGE